LAALKVYAENEFQNPNFDPEDESSIWFAIGTFVLWLGWYFFNGGSSYTLYATTVTAPSKVITNTILAANLAGGTAYFVKRPIHLYFDGNKKSL